MNQFPFYQELNHLTGSLADVSGNKTRDVATAVTEGRVIVEMADKIALLKVAQTPLTSLLTNVGKEWNGSSWTGQLKNKAVTSQREFSWMEDRYSGRTVKVVGAYLSTDVAITVTGAGVSPALVFTKGDVVLCPRTGERMFVSAAAGAVVTVSRSLGTTAAAALIDGDTLTKAGNANEENGGMRNINTTVKVKLSNLTQIHRTTIGVSGSLDNTLLYGGKELPYLREKMLTEHKFDIEDSFWRGEKSTQAAGNTLATQGHEITTTSGIDEFLNAGSSYIQDQNGYLTAPDLNNWIRNGAYYGDPTKVVIAGSLVIAAINETARGQIRLANEVEKYGIKISTYDTAFGMLKLVYNPRFTDVYAGYAYALDFTDECIRYRFMANRDTKLRTNIQAPDIDGEVDEFLTEAGLELREAPRHSILRGVSAA